MLIDCDACVMKGPGCQDCVVTVVLGFSAERSGTLRIDDDERAALDVLAESGLVPPLRLVHAVSSIEPDAAAPTPDGEGETAVGSG
ncbi:hypothetical protein E0H75_17955 [Kribbella capetownensis]|uniref:Uncharacterized protein n=2 Tax=Kribbella capetownensis TaxID=1572659 RepID=A0A4R0JTA7_9ACTN|nr:hypothetical protein [Kribbella capetownensis]TCC50159.1 hypothetical protein E0H75_17955 [Kribbella capetownensis]